jgi:hypothetical protein
VLDLIGSDWKRLGYKPNVSTACAAFSTFLHNWGNSSSGNGREVKRSSHKSFWGLYQGTIFSRPKQDPENTALTPAKSQSSGAKAQSLSRGMMSSNNC